MAYRNVEPEEMDINEMANQCGLFYDSPMHINFGYGCKSQSKEKQYPGCCYSFDCPLGYQKDEDDFDIIIKTKEVIK
jgi:hypothetical protein